MYYMMTTQQQQQPEQQQQQHGLPKTPPPPTFAWLPSPMPSPHNPMIQLMPSPNSTQNSSDTNAYVNFPPPSSSWHESVCHMPPATAPIFLTQQQQPPPTPLARQGHNNSNAPTTLLPTQQPMTLYCCTPVPVAPSAPTAGSMFVMASDAHQATTPKGGALKGPPPRRRLCFASCRQQRGTQLPAIPPPIPGDPHPGPRQLIVNYLSLELDSQDLYDLFTPYGEVEMARVATDSATGASIGYGFVYMRRHCDALVAIEHASGRILLSKRVRVSFAVPQRPISSLLYSTGAVFGPISDTALSS